MSLNDDSNDGADTLTKSKQKKPRSEAQIAATERMRDALAKKMDPEPTHKKMILKAIKEKLNGPSKNAPVEEESEEEAPPVPPKKVHKNPTRRAPVSSPPSDSESEEEEIVIVKKKKRKPKKRTIIYEQSESEEEPEPEPEPAPKPKPRETKTQQNVRSSSGFRVQNEPPKPSGPVYYFA